MSDDDQSESADTQLLTAEYKDGQLEIVEVGPYDKGKQKSTAGMGTDNSNDGTKYVQVLESDKNMVVDLLNFALVRDEDGQESFRLISTEDGNESDTTVTCVLANEDGEDQDGQESYVMVEGDSGPLVFLQSSLQQANIPPPKKMEVKKPALSPAEILEKAKALQKAKALLASQPSRAKRKGDLPPAHELLASPSFKLFLYSCKLCSFKCNAVKELTAHRASEHNTHLTKYRGARATAITLQCARCPYRGTNHTQLMNHVQKNHVEKPQQKPNKVYLDSAEVEAADVLVCGACGFESGCRDAFRAHIETEHGATTC